MRTWRAKALAASLILRELSELTDQLQRVAAPEAKGAEEITTSDANPDPHA